MKKISLVFAIISILFLSIALYIVIFRETTQNTMSLFFTASFIGFSSTALFLISERVNFKE